MDSLVLSPREEVVGFLPPPPGVTPDFVIPPLGGHRGQVVIIVLIIFSLVSTVFIGLRFYTCSFVTRKLGIEDCKHPYL